MKRFITLILIGKVALLGLSFYLETPKVIEYVYAAPVEEAVTSSDNVITEKEVLIEVKIEWTEDRIKQEVWNAAAKYNTFPEKMWTVMKCENDTLEPERQSHWDYTFSDPARGIYVGEQEQSYGLAQIHLPDHDVTYEQAIDPEFAIDFMAKNFADGKASWWTCYRMNY